MTLVVDTIADLVSKQVEAHRTVIWFDPERVYRHVADQLAPALRRSWGDARVLNYDHDRGFFALRKELERLWSGLEQPRIVVYVPLNPAETHNALREFCASGVQMSPGQQPKERNTRLADMAALALSAVFPKAKAEELVQQIRCGQLSLRELDDIVERGIEAHTGTIAVIFGSESVREVASRFVSDESIDSEINDRGLQGSVIALFSDAFGVPFHDQADLSSLRAQLARLVLQTELLCSSPEPLPPSLTGLPTAEGEVGRQAAIDLARDWRSRFDLTATYVHWADRLQAELGLGQLDLPLGVLSKLETFRCTEEQLQTAVERALLCQEDGHLIELARGRVDGFWAGHDPSLKIRWKIILEAGQLLWEANRLRGELKGKSWSAQALVERYTGGAKLDKPWCVLDTAFRHLEHDFHLFDPDPEQHDPLLRLVAHARQRYSQAADELAERFIHAYQDARFDLPETLLQLQVYSQIVAPAMEQDKVAYILVDALRYEMALELSQMLEAACFCELVPALAMPPTITEVGMAALLPRAERGVSVVPGHSGKLALKVDGKSLRNRQERMAHLESRLDIPVVTTKLEQLVPLTKRRLRKELQEARLIVVTASEEIDGLWESSPAQARRMMDDALVQLRRAAKTLFGLGVGTMVITSDHGCLYGEGLMAGEGIEAPGGETVDLHRRAWIGRGGAANSALLRAPLSAFGIGGDLEYATPWNLSYLKVAGGSTDYFHGGLSMQELVIPVLTIEQGPAGGPQVFGEVAWTLTPGSAKITTRFFSVTVEGRLTELLPVGRPHVRAEIRLGNRVISVPVSAAYGFAEDTKDVVLSLADDGLSIRPNTITLMITEPLEAAEATVLLINATTGVGLAWMNIEVGIAL